jgi:hypothetical protein
MVLLMRIGLAPAAEPGAVLAEGAWSKAVASGDGDSLRGRLVLVERRVVVGGRAHFPRQERHGVSVYVELQNARDVVGPALRVYCDFVNNLRCRMVDKDGNDVASKPGAFGGGVPQAEWVSLPCEASIRVRSSPFGLHRENAVVISPTLHGGWVIEDNDPKEYFLSGTFTANQATEKESDEHVWRGTLELPAIRVASPAAPDPIVGLVAQLAATHGLWLNGAYPKLDTPEDAPVKQALPEVFERTSPLQGKVTKFDIIEQRDVSIPTVADRKLGMAERYTAVRVRTNVGEKIVLLQRSRTDWWSRIYEVR